jgi:hypothetical protein
MLKKQAQGAMTHRIPPQTPQRRIDRPKLLGERDTLTENRENSPQLPNHDETEEYDRWTIWTTTLR